MGLLTMITGRWLSEYPNDSRVRSTQTQRWRREIENIYYRVPCSLPYQLSCPNRVTLKRWITWGDPFFLPG